MTLYDDDGIALDDHGVTVKSYHLPGRPKTIAYTEIQSVEMIDLALFTGSYRLVGISLGRPTTYFHWDRNRRGKTHGLRLDLGRRLKVAITPDDPERVLALLKSRTG